MCDEQLYLNCGPDHTCQCSKGESWSEIQQKCTLLAGSYCFRSRLNCIDNAYCPREPVRYSFVGGYRHRENEAGSWTRDAKVREIQSDIRNLSLTEQKCTCSPDHRQSWDGLCIKMPTFGEICIPSEGCSKYNILMSNNTRRAVNSFLVCTNGRCACDTTTVEEVGLNSSHRCVKPLGVDCEENECFTGGECAGTCQCIDKTHFQSENGTCEKRRGYMELCGSDNECDYHQNNLVCGDDHVCRCKGGTVLDPTSNRCLATPGLPCEPDVHACVPNAQCVKIISGEGKVSHTCLCRDDTRVAVGRKDYCYVEEGKRCFADGNQNFTTRTCLPGLVCRQNICSCLYKDYQVYHQDMEACKSQLEGPCSTTSNCDVENSECVAEGGIQKCQCKPGFIEFGSKCQIAFGESCDQNQWSTLKCHQYGPLECSDRGLCECPDFQQYDSDTLLCRGLVGAKCSGDWIEVGNGEKHKFCVEGATCKKRLGLEEGVCSCLNPSLTQADRTCGK